MNLLKDVMKKMGLTQGSENDWIFHIVILSLLVGFTTIMLIDNINEISNNFEETGIRMTDDERKCYDLCYPHNYFYSDGFFSADECECSNTFRKGDE